MKRAEVFDPRTVTKHLRDRVRGGADPASFFCEPGEDVLSPVDPNAVGSQEPSPEMIELEFNQEPPGLLEQRERDTVVLEAVLQGKDRRVRQPGAPGLWQTRQVRIDVRFKPDKGQFSFHPHQPSLGKPAQDYPRLDLGRFARGWSGDDDKRALPTQRREHSSEGHPVVIGDLVKARGGDPLRPIKKPKSSFALKR